MVTGLCISFGARYSHFKIWDPSGPKLARKRGCPKVNVGGLFIGGSMTHELPKKFPDLLNNLVHILLQFREDTSLINWLIVMVGFSNMTAFKNRDFC